MSTNIWHVENEDMGDFYFDADLKVNEQDDSLDFTLAIGHFKNPGDWE